MKFPTIILVLIFAISAHAATFTVTRTDDRNAICNPGVDCSLREAISAANAVSTDDIIDFDSTVFASVQTIQITLRAPLIINNGVLSINGTGANLLTISGLNKTLLVFYVEAQTTATISNLTVTNGFGGLSNSGILTLNNVSVTNNSTSPVPFSNSGLGGGIFNRRFAKTTINNSTISNNVANSRGGGILNDGGTVVIDNSNVTGNYSLNGSGIYSADGNLTVTNSIISDNQRSSGIYNNSGTVTITGSTINNNANGILSINYSTVNVTSSTISRNIRSGILNLGGSTFNLVNSTISSNTSFPEDSGSGGGGGISNDWIMNITNSTIVGNSAVNGGGIYTNSDKVSIRNSIIGDNTARNSAPDFFGTCASQGYNIIENTNGTTITGSTTGNILGQDPMLDSILRNNGGPTLTHALLSGSPAINAGDNTNAPLTDQRGFARIVGGTIDIGAFEFAPVKSRKRVRFF